ncbi:hypothetical protein V8E53_011297 [Lactarius tabidus]
MWCDQSSRTGGDPGPLFLWVGVAAVFCRKILADYMIMDVEIAFRESVFTRSGTRQQLLDQAPPLEPTADVQGPFTPALGLQIARKNFPYIEGTGGLYFREASDNDCVLLLTARHVALPTSKHFNDTYDRKNNSTPRLDVIHLGDQAYQNAAEAIASKIGREADVIKHYKGILRAEESKASLEQLKKIANERVLGHVRYAPPISVNTGEKGFTEDWALIGLDHERFDWNTFRGDVINLGAIPMGECKEKIHPHPKTRAKFNYPEDGLMPLRDFVKDGELRSPTMVDANGEDCIIVIKNGLSTSLTFGRASGIESFVRHYEDYGICAFHKDGPFSASGDSGSIIGGANNRIIGLLTGGGGVTPTSDITYATPYYFSRGIPCPLPRQAYQEALPQVSPLPEPGNPGLGDNIDARR